MNIWTFEQGSAEWLELRVGRITASRYKDARDRLKPAKGETIGRPSAKCNAYAAQVAVERIAGRSIDKMFESWQMREGKEQEPLARAAYDVETGNIVQEVGAITTDDGLFLYSPDGLIGDDGLLEIKTLLSADVICRVVGEGDLSEYMDQCMGGLWLTGRQWIDLVLWAPALEPIGRQLTIHRITRDENAIEALEADLLDFARRVAETEAKIRRVEAPAGLVLDSGAEAERPEAEQQEREAAERRQREEQEAAARAEQQRQESEERARKHDEFMRDLIGAPAAPAPATANVVPMPTKAPAAPAAAPAGPPTLKLMEINARLAPLSIDDAGLTALGFPPVATEKNAKLRRESDWQAICAAIAQHVVAVANGRREVAA